MIRYCLLVGILSLSSLTAIAQEPFKYEKKITELVEPYREHQKFNAISIGVLSNGEVWEKSFGSLDSTSDSKPNSNTIYEIGSISKVFTSLLLAQAVESGKLKLDDPISTIMTELEKENPAVGSSITFKHLSHHVSGLPVMPLNIAPKDSTNPFADYDRPSLVEYMKSAQPKRKPGVEYEYSNLAAGLLGDLLARQADTSYEKLLKTQLTEQLEMLDTSITLSSDQKSRLAPPHNLALLPDSSWDFDALAGCGAIRSNVDDMLTFAKAVLNPPKGPLGEAIDLAWKKQKEAVGGQHAMGLGWMIAQDGATRWHNGQTGGYHSMILINRSLKTAVVLLSNTANPQLDQLTEQIFRAVIGMEVKPTQFDAEFQVKPEVAKRLEGKYQLAPGAIITVQVKDGKMMAQLTGQQFLALIPKSETEWKYQLVDATLKFELPEKGNSPKVTLFQSGRELPAPRVKK
jgi:serine-type D-Ala-D-Ala carboxypeptidase/endopeptidase